MGMGLVKFARERFCGMRFNAWILDTARKRAGYTKSGGAVFDQGRVALCGGEGLALSGFSATVPGGQSVLSVRI
jgi:hypothetical protein